jgi:hypothetical protein
MNLSLALSATHASGTHEPLGFHIVGCLLPDARFGVPEISDGALQYRHGEIVQRVLLGPARARRMHRSYAPGRGRLQVGGARRDLLLRGQRLSLVIAPPGSGKTGIVERVATFEVAYRHGRPAVATQTNAQACDVARRMKTGFPKLRVTLFVKEDFSVPSWVLAIPGLIIARKSGQVPPGPGIVIANATRWSWMDRGQVQPFTQLIVDEAYQLADYRFAQISELAHRILLVGDPGQIEPIVSCEIERWACEQDPSSRYCPRAACRGSPCRDVRGALRADAWPV